MQNENKYFASANTEKGFISYYDEVYGQLDMVYIIKGGPGTGKSHFIRGVADEAERRGLDVEYFYCSTDPLSLDGIIIEQLKTAVIDGTFPHTYDPQYPGIRDKIINLGENWDGNKLKRRGDEICEMIQRKNNLYNNVYNYLAAAGRIEGEISLCNKKCVNLEKMRAAVGRLTRQWKNGAGFEKQLRVVEAMSHTGHILYGTYHNNAENKYVIRDRYGIGGLFTELVMDIARQMRLKVFYSPGCVDTSVVVALYLPEVSCSFVIDDDGIDKKQINMDRFVDGEAIRRNKQKNRFARRCLSSLYEGVQKGFDEIFYLHTKVEECYISVLDFSKNAEMQKKVIDEIFL